MYREVPNCILQLGLGLRLRLMLRFWLGLEYLTVSCVARDSRWERPRSRALEEVKNAIRGRGRSRGRGRGRGKLELNCVIK